MNRICAWCWTAASIAALCVSPVAAQEWPRLKPVSFVVGFGPGSATDVTARMIGSKLSEAIGQSVVIENRGGAGGNVAAQTVRRAAPDGYTILVTAVAFVINQSLYSNAGYDAVKDFVPIALGPSTPSVITVHPSVSAQSIQELINAAKMSKLAYASPGSGTPSHLTMERLKSIAGMDLTHVPYQPATAAGAALGGHVQVAITTLAPAAPHIKAGKLRALAVSASQRSPVLPEVPTLIELGYSGFDDVTWTGFFAPAGTSAAIVERINAEINRIVETPDISDKLAAQGLTSRRNSPAEFAAQIRAELPKWANAVKHSGAKAD
jgi:tripartite-type tricarboxylate transporter receptor subunit TctC